MLDKGWYSVPETFTDAYGYLIQGGDTLLVDRVGDYTRGIKIVYAKTFRDGRFCQYERGMFVTTGGAENWTKNLVKLEGKDLKKLEAAIEATKKSHPDHHVSMVNNYTMGSDPEIFAERGDGMILPAFEFLAKEDKALSKKVSRDSLYPPQPPYWDGFQGEFQIQPFTCIAYGTDRIQTQLANTLKLARKVDKKARLVGTPVQVIPADVLTAASDEHVALGCMPSQNAYNMAGEAIEDGRQLNIRFAGFHIHFSLQNKEEKDRVNEIVQMMDNIVGVTSVAVLNGLENPIRRKYYGLAGEYRTPKYGLEYRVLSSAPLWHPALVHLHMNFARGAAQMAIAKFDMWEGSHDETVAIINECDVKGARKALKRNADLIGGLLRHYYITPNLARTYKSKVITDNSKAIFDTLIMKGASQFMDLDIEKNWHLSDCKWVTHAEADGCQMWKFAQEVARA